MVGSVKIPIMVIACILCLFTGFIAGHIQVSAKDPPAVSPGPRNEQHGHAIPTAAVGNRLAAMGIYECPGAAGGHLHLVA